MAEVLSRPRNSLIQNFGKHCARIITYGVFSPYVDNQRVTNIYAQYTNRPSYFLLYTYEVFLAFSCAKKYFLQDSSLMNAEKPKKQKQILAFPLPGEVMREFEKVAQAEHMEPTRFAALIISKFSDLKQGHGISALASIPKDNFKLRPGRTPSTASTPDLRLVGAASENPV